MRSIPAVVCFIALLSSCRGAPAAPRVPPDVPAFAAGVAEGSEVAWADARTVTLRHPGSDTTQLTEQTRRRLVSEGWTVQIDTSTPNLGAMELHREEERLSVGVLPSRGATTVTLTLLGLAP